MDVRVGLWVVTSGVLAGEIVAAQWAVPAAVLPAVAGLAVVTWLARRRRSPVILWVAVAVGSMAIGTTRMAAIVDPVLSPDEVSRLALPLRTVLTGRVDEAPERQRGRCVLVVRAETVVSGGARRAVSGRVRLVLRHPHRHWRYGDRLQAPTTLRRPRNFENPGRFDYVGHLMRRGIRVTGSVWQGEVVTRLPGRARGARAWLERWRTRLAARIASVVPPPEGAVLQALVMGEEGGVATDLRDAFTRAGVVHVLSVSGLHVGLVAAASFAVARWLLGRSEWVLLTTDAARVAAVASLGPVLLYAALAGLGVATLRSALMVTAAVLARLLGRPVDVLRTLALAALVLALAWPGTPLDIGFQLSFVSVLAIVCGVRRLGVKTTEPVGGAGRGARLRAWLHEALLVSPCALIGTAPLTAFHFHQVSLVGVIANPLVVPVFGSVVVGLGLAGAFLEPVSATASAVLFRTAGLTLRPGIRLVRLLATPAWASVDVPIPSPLELALLYAALGGLLLLPRRGARLLVVLTVAGLLADTGWWLHRRIATRALRVTFLDVGQGDAAVIELPGGRVVVVDAGGFPGSDFDTGSAVVGPFLWAQKILRIDALAMTHAHPDHSGGLPYLLVHHRPREFWWTGVAGEGASWARLERALVAGDTRVRVLTAGAPLPAFVAAVAVLHPPDASWRSLNDSSLTLRVTHGGAAVLLTGDIEARAEEQLLRAPARLASAVLKVPHHGSRTSSTPAFVAAVAPRVAVMSVGADNRYGLPSPEVEARYRAAGTCLLRTDRCGAVTVELDGPALRVWTRRAECACPPRSSDQAARVRPWRSAYITRPTRSRTPSFWKMLVRWVFTVRSLMVSVMPTSLFL